MLSALLGGGLVMHAFVRISMSRANNIVRWIDCREIVGRKQDPGAEATKVAAWYDVG